MGLLDYSTNPASNGVVAGVQYLPVGALPAQVGVAERQIMADLANWLLTPTFPSTAAITAATVKTTANNTGRNIVVGDDAYIGDANITNGLKISGQADSTSGFIQFGSQTALLGVQAGGGLTYGGFTLFNNGNLTAGVINSIYGYVPYSSNNPAGFISGITSGMVTSALGFAPISNVVPGNFTAGYLKADPTAYITVSGNYVYFNLDTGKYLKFDRGNNRLYFNGGSGEVVSFDAAGNIRCTGQVYAQQGGV